MKELRTLYEFTIPKLIEKEVSKQETVGAETVTITKKEKVKEDCYIRIIKPTRRMYEAADIFYSVSVGEFIKMGLLPLSLIAKRYANDGGTLNEIDRGRLEAYTAELKTLEKQFVSLSPQSSETAEEERKAILLKMNDVGIAIEQLKNDYSSIYENTAESKARHKTAIWWVLHICQIKKNDKYEYLFDGETYEQRLESYDEFAEEGSPFTNEVIQRISYLMAFWIAAKSDVEEKDFKSIDEVYLKGISEYKLDETPSITVKETPQNEVTEPTTPK